MDEQENTPEDLSVSTPEETETIEYEVPMNAAGEIDWTNTDDDALTELRAKAEQAFLAESIKDTAEVDVELLARIGEHVTAMRAEQDARTTQAEEKAAEIAKLTESLGIEGGTWKPEDGPGGDPDKVDTEAPAEAEAPAESAEEDVVEEEPEPVTADDRQLASVSVVNRRPVRAASLPGTGRMVQPSRGRKADLSLVASGAVHKFADGGPTLAGVAELAEQARHDNIRNGGGRSDSRAYLARYTRTQPDEFTFDGGPEDAEKWQDVLNWNPSVEELVASGCGPCETVYDYVDDSEVGVLVQVPERVFTRGAMCFPNSIDMCDVIAQLADSVGCYDPNTDLVKTPLEFDCPADRNEIKICARWMSILFNNFVARSNPELYEDAIRKTLKAHQINVHLDTLMTMVNDTSIWTADLTTVDVFTHYEDGAGSALLTALEIVVEINRTKYCLGATAALEAVFPRWVLGAVRADMARVNGQPVYDVSNEQIQSWFNTRGARAQFVDYWQMIPGDASAIAYPESFHGLFYPANTFIRGTQGTLDLGRDIRTGSDIEANKYRMFTEDFYQTGSIKDGASLVKLPSRSTGARATDVAITVEAALAEDHLTRNYPAPV